jgi:Undecaprenyl-phosphate galactose phosphotransferase WbaP
MQSPVDARAVSPFEALDRQAGALPGRLTETWKRRLVNFALVASDLLLAALVWGAAYILQNALGKSGPLTDVATATVVSNMVAWVGLRGLLGLYPGYGLNQVEELRRQTHAVLATVTITTVFAVAFQIGDLLSRLLLVMGFLGLCVLAPLVRNLVKRTMKALGAWGKPVAILSHGETGTELAELLKREWGLGFRPVAVFDSRIALAQEMLEDGTLDGGMRLGRGGEIDTAIFSVPNVRREHLSEFVEWASVRFRHVILVPDLSGVTNSAVVARDLGGTLGVEIKHNLLDPWTRRVKRTLDLVATLIGGSLILPFFLTLFLLVWFELRGSVFYKDQRLGRDGRTFSCIKFRTMVPDAETVLQGMLAENDELREEYLRYHKLRDDSRVTRVGHFLRKTSLDELPQLWNVLRGEMSLIGPRPYLPRESEDMGVKQREILRVYPGITGLWQAGGRNHASFSERVQMDSYYVRNWSIWLDLVILARTVRTLVLSRGAAY